MKEIWFDQFDYCDESKVWKSMAENDQWNYENGKSVMKILDSIDGSIIERPGDLSPRNWLFQVARISGS